MTGEKLRSLLPQITNQNLAALVTEWIDTQADIDRLNQSHSAACNGTCGDEPANGISQQMDMIGQEQRYLIRKITETAAQSSAEIEAKLIVWSELIVTQGESDVWTPPSDQLVLSVIDDIGVL